MANAYWTSWYSPNTDLDRESVDTAPFKWCVTGSTMDDQVTICAEISANNESVVWDLVATHFTVNSKRFCNYVPLEQKGKFNDRFKCLETK